MPNSIVQSLRAILDTSAERLLALGERLRGRTLLAFLLAGLVIRLAGSFLDGTRDVEWWKAFGTFAVTQDLSEIYGAEDREILRRYRQGLPRAQLLAETQRSIPYKAYKTADTAYAYPQPPIFIYPIYLSTLAYSWVDPELTNNRIFNFFLNLPQIAASGLIALVIFAAGRSAFGRQRALLAAVVYWLNPVAILNSPIQGYLDPLCMLFALCSVAALYYRRLGLAFVFLTLAFMTKPQGVLIAPIVLALGLVEHGIRASLRAAGTAIATGIAVSLPFIATHHTLSMVQGVLSISHASQDLTRATLNLWWPVQYGYNVVQHAVGSGSIRTAVATALGADNIWSFSAPAAQLTPLIGFNVQVIGFLLLIGFTILNLRYLLQTFRSDRRAIVVAAALQVYGYTMLRVGVQENHYFLLIPLLTFVAFTDRSVLRYYLAICLVFLVQGLTFYGLGRDFNPVRSLLSNLYLGWLTVICALLNVALFARISLHYLRLRPIGRPASATP